MLQSTFACLAACVFLSGCVAAQRTATPETLDRLEHIHIVAMQSPPLLFPKRHLNDEILADAVHLSIFDQAIVASIVIKLKKPREEEPWEQEYEKAQKLLASGNIWFPALVLAEQTHQQLAMMADRTSDLRPSIQPLIKDGDILLYPIGGRSLSDDVTEVLTQGALPYYSYTDVYWLTKQWYAAGASQIDYPDLASDGTAGVLEVGVMQYEYAIGLFLVQVMMRLIDPATGEVVARVRNASNPKVDDPELLFLNDAAQLKDKFSEISAQLVKDSLVEIGLMQ